MGLIHGVGQLEDGGELGDHYLFPDRKGGEFRVIQIVGDAARHKGHLQHLFRGQPKDIHAADNVKGAPAVLPGADEAAAAVQHGGQLQYGGLKSVDFFQLVKQLSCILADKPAMVLITVEGSGHCPGAGQGVLPKEVCPFAVGLGAQHIAEDSLGKVHRGGEYLLNVRGEAYHTPIDEQRGIQQRGTALRYAIAQSYTLGGHGPY